MADGVEIDPSELEPVEFWSWLLRHLIGLLLNPATTGQAAANLAKRIEEARVKLDTLKAAEGSGPELSDEELVAEYEIRARLMPLQHLEPFATAYLERSMLPALDEMYEAWREKHRPRLELVGGEG